MHLSEHHCSPLVFIMITGYIESRRPFLHTHPSHEPDPVIHMKGSPAALSNASVTHGSYNAFVQRGIRASVFLYSNHNKLVHNLCGKVCVSLHFFLPFFFYSFLKLVTDNEPISGIKLAFSCKHYLAVETIYHNLSKMN